MNDGVRGVFASLKVTNNEVNKSTNKEIKTADETNQRYAAGKQKTVTVKRKNGDMVETIRKTSQLKTTTVDQINDISYHGWLGRGITDNEILEIAIERLYQTLKK